MKARSLFVATIALAVVVLGAALTNLAVLPLARPFW